MPTHRGYDLTMLAAIIGIALAGGDWTPTPDEQKLVQALSSHDGPPSCDDLDAMVDDPVASLERVVEHVTMPPWAGMSAARCLIVNHPQSAEPTISQWMDDPEKLGLAKLVLLSVDQLPEPMALDVARVALRGPHAVEARKRLPKSTRPAVRALVTP